MTTPSTISEHTDAAICPVCSERSHYDYSGRDLMFDLYERYDYHRCTCCGAVFQYPMPNMGVVATFYPQNYSIYDEHERVRKVSWWRQALLAKARGYTHLSVTFPARMLATLLAPFMGPCFCAVSLGLVRSGYGEACA